MYLKNVTRDTTVGTRIALANNSFSRLAGLLGKRRLEAGCGLLIQPSMSVHTVGMLFAIDVVALDARLRVLKLWHQLPPFRITGIDWKIASMLELPAGKIEECRMVVGDQLELSSGPPTPGR
jgi:uncharacterized membrane protein (UPF0127 family)